MVVAWMWLEQLIAANDHRGDFYDGKRAAAQYFYGYELPKVGPQLICWETWIAPPGRAASWF